MKSWVCSIGSIILSLLLNSTAFGQWQASSNGIQSNVVYCLVEAGDGSIIAGTANGVFRSQDFGISWSNSSAGLVTGDSTILRAGSHNGRLFIGTEEILYYSDNDGADWSVSQNFGSRIFGICELQGDVFVATLDNGVYKSDNNGLTWISANSGMTTDSIFSIYAKDDYLLAGTYGQGIFYSNDQGQNWSHVLSNNNPLLVKSITATSTKVFASVTEMVNGTVPFYNPYRSNNDGQSWSMFYSSDLPTLGNFYVTAMHGTGNSVIFAGGGNIYLSMDNGSTWSVFMNGITATSPFGIGCFLETDNYIFCGLEAGGTDHCFRVPKNQVSTAVTSPEQVVLLELFPNPSDGSSITLNYKLNGNQECAWTVYNASGRRVFEKQLTSFEGQIRMPKRLEAGIYVSIVETSQDPLHAERLIVVR